MDHAVERRSLAVTSAAPEDQALELGDLALLAIQRDGLAMESMPQPRKRVRSAVTGRAAVAVDALPALIEVPSWPLEFTSTGLAGPAIAVRFTPARNAAVCCPAVPIRIRPDSPATPTWPM